jgi:hypothetical protein
VPFKINYLGKLLLYLFYFGRCSTKVAEIKCSASGGSVNGKTQKTPLEENPRPHRRGDKVEQKSKDYLLIAGN